MQDELEGLHFLHIYYKLVKWSRELEPDGMTVGRESKRAGPHFTFRQEIKRKALPKQDDHDDVW